MPEKKIVLVGGGGHCKSVLDAVLRTGMYCEIVITDPSIEPGTTVMGCRVAGNDDVLPSLLMNGFTDAIITVGSLGNTNVRRKLAGKVEVLGFNLQRIIDPSAAVSPYARIGRGTFIGKNAVVNAEAVIGENCIVNTGAIVEHECIIGDFAHVAVGSILCGSVQIGGNCLLGAGSTVIQGRIIGENSVIGAGAVVNRDLPSNCLAVGVPAKVVKKI